MNRLCESLKAYLYETLNVTIETHPMEESKQSAIFSDRRI